MRVLGLETATPVCSVALAEAGRVAVEYTTDLGSHHTERLLPMVHRVLDDAGLRPGDLDGVAVASGPGSFTGLRIGMGTAKGLCMASGLALLPVPTLAGLAFGAACEGVPVCAMLDARRGEVYAGVYQMDGEGLAVLRPDAALPAADLVPLLPRPVLLVGEGARVYREALREGLGAAARFVPDASNRPRAASIALLGAARLAAGEAADLESAEPRYLRRSQAERVREARLRHG